MSPFDRREANTGGREGAIAAAALSSDAVGAVELARGERLTPPPGRALLQVESGLTAVSHCLEDGRRQILCLNVAGDVICPICSNDCWVEALAPSRLALLGADLGAGSEADAMRAMFALTHERLAQANLRLTMLGRLDGAERVALFLADMCRKIGHEVGAGATFVLPMSREDIADYLGLNAETVSRIFTRMKRAGLVRFPSRNEYVVPDFAAVAARAPIDMPAGPARAKEAVP